MMMTDSSEPCTATSSICRACPSNPIIAQRGGSAPRRLTDSSAVAAGLIGGRNLAVAQPVDARLGVDDDSHYMKNNIS